MLNKLILSGLLVLISVAASSKSFFIITDIEAQKEYVLRKGAKIEYQKTGENIRYTGRIKSIEQDALVIGKNRVQVNSIATVKALSVPLGLRIAAVGVYALSAASVVSLTMNNAYAFSIYQQSRWTFILGGLALYALMKKKTFTASENVKFQIIHTSKS